jgi:phosphatidate cytidylyltransferase
MLKKRVITSIIGIPVLVVAIWFEEFLPWFTMFVALLGVLASLEFSRLVNASRAQTFAFYGACMTFFFILLRDVNILEIIDTAFSTAYILPLLLAALVLPLLWSWLPVRFRGEGSTWKGGVWTIIGIIYLGWTLGHLVALRGIDDGRNWVYLAIFAAFAYDTAAYFTGRSLGRHKMAPRISPGKTWEGAAGGVIGAVLLSLFFTLDTPLGLPITWGHAVVLGLLVSVFGQIGDLLESAFKRYTSVKDSGTTLPGHGGFLDRLDSVVFSGLVVYYYVIWVIQ